MDNKEMSTWQKMKAAGLIVANKRKIERMIQLLPKDYQLEFVKFYAHWHNSGLPASEFGIKMAEKLRSFPDSVKKKAGVEEVLNAIHL